MAVAEDVRGPVATGSLILERLEAEARNRGADRIVLDSCETPVNSTFATDIE
jgi:hypothetical protein